MTVNWRGYDARMLRKRKHLRTPKAGPLNCVSRDLEEFVRVHDQTVGTTHQ
jgi:hypothetical protein